MPVEEDLNNLETIGIAGTDFVLVPVADYVCLLHIRRQLEGLHADRNIILGRAGKSLLDRNPDVAHFFIQNLGRYSVAILLKKCRRKFGSARTPSRSAAYRFWDKLKASQKKSI